MQSPVRLAAALATVTMLAGCGIFDTAEKFPPICPSLALLNDAADITRFKGAGHDITDQVLDGRITAVPAQCKADGKNVVTTTLHLQASLTRGTAATGRDLAVPYIVTVTDGDKIVDQQDYQLVTTFPPNVSTVNLTGQDIELRFPVTAKKNASAYKVYLGFRLTPAELAFNRVRGPR